MSSGNIHERHATPYPGLRPFRQDEAELFFGRGEQVEAMLTKLETHRFLAIVGASGCGKSSWSARACCRHSKRAICRTLRPRG